MRLEWWEAVLLGFIQGTTEWLPISSSGHLALSRHALGLAPSTFYDLILHAGTLLVVLWVYRWRIVQILAALAATPADARQQGWKEALWGHPDRRLAWIVALGSVPIGVVGFLLEAQVEAAFASLRTVGLSLLATGVLLWSTRRLDPERITDSMGARDGLWVGVWQAFALLPGISRSGSTIAAGLHIGLSRRAAADFAFLLAIPALTGAMLFKATDAQAAWGDPMLWLGFAISTVVGYLTLTALIGFVTRRGLHPFAWYCWGVGGGALAASLV